MSSDEQHVLAVFQTHTYKETAAICGISVGKVHRIVTEAGARRYEPRIRERKEKRELQLAILKDLINNTVTADVLAFMDGLPDDSAQAIIFSPPYNIGKGYEAHADRLRHVYYVGWMMQVVSECARVVKPGGTVAVEVGVTRNDRGERIPLQQIFYPMLVDAGLTWQNTIPWVAPHGLTPPKHDRCAGRHEDILIFTKGAPLVFNANSAAVPQKNPAKRAFKGEKKGQLSGRPLGAYPADVWNEDHARNNTSDHNGHPAPFSLALARKLVNLYSLPGAEQGPVIDPFCGSGTTAHACIELGRSFIGADLSYSALRDERLRKAVPDLVCDLPGVTPESLAIWQAEAHRVDAPALPLGLSA